MSTPTEKDLATVTDGELLALPGGTIPPGRLTEFFTRRAEILHQRDMGQVMLELSGSSSRRFFIFPETDPKRREAEDRRRAWLAYEASMRQLREREDRLLARIDEQVRIDRQRLTEIEDKAIRLRDGRRVYVDGDRYRDEQGRLLDGVDENEAREQHRQHPDASTWAERQTIQERLEVHERQRQRILREREERERDAQTLSPEELDRKRREAEQRLSAEEKAFNERVQTAYAAATSKSPADLTATYSADYSDLDGGSADAGRTTSYAKTQDRAGTTLAVNFTPAAEGQADADQPEIPQPPGPNAPKVQA